ncbi:hypothetical protein GCM10020295_34530 [Streptomyces cinereospinus]
MWVRDLDRPPFRVGPAGPLGRGRGVARTSGVSRGWRAGGVSRGAWAVVVGGVAGGVGRGGGGVSRGAWAVVVGGVAVAWGRVRYRRRRCSAMAAAVPPATAPTPAAAGMPTFAALRPVR